MFIRIDNQSSDPIYFQIAEAFKREIARGGLQADEALPSIRNLAKDLRISVITTKRAYEELEKDIPWRARGALFRRATKSSCGRNA